LSVTTELRDRLATASAPVAAAYSFAARAHAGQRQVADGAPYLEHVLAVARLLEGAGFPDDVVAAALLHDVLEKTDVRPLEIRARFGPRVARLVRAMTEPDDVAAFPLRKAIHRAQVMNAGTDVEAIFAADKLANAMTLRAAIERDGKQAVRRRVGPQFNDKLDHYQATLDLLGKSKPPPPFLDSLAEELRLLWK
jgi:(p)ppGpp synthase/HD superfamily hydrolase